MSTRDLAKAKNLEKYWRPESSGFGTPRIHIDSINEKRPEANCEKYPYEGQLVLYGDYTFTEEGRHGREITTEGSYEYRSGSGLFLIKNEQSKPTQREIISEINQIVGDDGKISPIKSIQRHHLWNFFKSADEFNQVSLRTDEGKKTVSDILMSGDIGESSTVESHLENHLIESARVMFDPPSNVDPVVVKYNRGQLEIPDEPPEALEYVVQLFERDVIHPSSQ
ncbi:hypothetical protein [Haloferax sp. Atlit-4N]|uniref:hypothetical protein n=1 Tax=Haloferax sp. Atlit-4N TaxID=2077206 RepID=UPI0011C0270A|nr:hypothetical protein [Haloferax sp. Atlit-4N]